MLNISRTHPIKEKDLSTFRSMQKIMDARDYKKLNRFLWVFTAILFFILFLPWTQTVQGDGYVTTLRPEQRPQSIQSPIPGKIEKWYVQEGALVRKGDTILKISEIKPEYADPALVTRANEQLQSKVRSTESYTSKVNAIRDQLNALATERQLKMEQARNYLEQSRLKVQEDSTDLLAAQTNMEIAQRQYERTLTLQKEGLKPMTDLEDKEVKLQEARAKLMAATNALGISRNNLVNTRLELTRLDAEYRDKIGKANSELYSAQSAGLDAEAEVNKLRSQISGYTLRNAMYYVTAPQAGYLQKAVKSGVGETIKEGEKLVGIVPSDAEMAVEAFVEPLDLALLHPGEAVRVQFDGWPAIVFSGWPNATYGTYGGRIVAVERTISPNGKFRVLIAPDPNEPGWPEAVAAGSGARTLALLNDVPIWYEIWRQINGFPLEYYQGENEDK